jgi:hypothetical protein
MSHAPTPIYTWRKLPDRQAILQEAIRILRARREAAPVEAIGEAWAPSAEEGHEPQTPHSRLVCLISDFDERKDWDELKALVPQCDLNAWDEDGDTPLSHASEAALVRYLVEQGADVNKKNEDGTTALHRAFWDETVETLVELGADTEAVDDEGKKPVDHFRETNQASIHDKFAGLPLALDRALARRTAKEEAAARAEAALTDAPTQTRAPRKRS